MSEEKPCVRQVIVVEGRYDRAAVLRAVDATVVETGGFHLFHDREQLEYFRMLAEKRGVILLTDSDGAGLVIRGKLRGMLGENCEILQAYVPRIPGKERRKDHPSRAGVLGVEAMDRETILLALRNCGADFGSSGRHRGGITKADLYDLGLSGTSESAARRLELQAALDLPRELSSNALLDALNATMTLEELRVLLQGTAQKSANDRDPS